MSKEFFVGHRIYIFVWKPISRCFKPFHYSVKNLFVSFRFMGAIFLKKKSDEKLKTFVMYFFYQKIE